MFTKLVVTVATVIRIAPDIPRPRARSMAPGLLLPAALAAIAPSGISHRLVRASPKKTAAPALRRDAV
jgi:hypothetical protein